MQFNTLRCTIKPILSVLTDSATYLTVFRQNASRNLGRSFPYAGSQPRELSRLRFVTWLSDLAIQFAPDRAALL